MNNEYIITNRKQLYRNDVKIQKIQFLFVLLLV